jgi:hypothetical protein
VAKGSSVETTLGSGRDGEDDLALVHEGSVRDGMLLRVHLGPSTGRRTSWVWARRATFPHRGPGEGALGEAATASPSRRCMRSARVDSRGR